MRTVYVSRTNRGHCGNRNDIRTDATAVLLRRVPTYNSVEQNKRDLDDAISYFVRQRIAIAIEPANLDPSIDE